MYFYTYNYQFYLYIGTPELGSFTGEQEDLFQRRYEEGYNLYSDLCYVSWLEIHHPEALHRYNLISAGDCVLQSVASQFDDVTPLCPAVTLSNPPEATSSTPTYSSSGAARGPSLIGATPVSSPPSGGPGPSLIGATPVFSLPSGATPEPSLIGATPEPSLTGATPV